MEEIQDNGMTNSSLFRENDGVNLTKVLSKRFTSQKSLENDLQYFIENDVTDTTVKLWCISKASELFTIFKAFQNEKIKKS